MAVLVTKGTTQVIHNYLADKAARKQFNVMSFCVALDGKRAVVETQLWSWVGYRVDVNDTWKNKAKTTHYYIKSVQFLAQYLC